MSLRLYELAAAQGMSGNFSEIKIGDMYSVAVDQAYKLISEYVPLIFVNESVDASINNMPDHLLFGATNLLDVAAPQTDKGGFSIEPNSAKFEHTFIALENGNGLAPAADSVAFYEQTVMHEILHSLGLKHPFHESPKLPEELDSKHYTTMSYTSRFSNMYSEAGNAITPMALDLAALNALYDGLQAKATTATNYAHLQANQTRDLEGEDGEIAIGRGFYCIWDTGGIDIIDFSSSTERVHINLMNATLGNNEYDIAIEQLLLVMLQSAGFSTLPDHLLSYYQIPPSDSAHTIGVGGFISAEFNSTTLGAGGFTIAAKTNQFADNLIENASGGSNDDVIFGNEGVNKLNGGAGDDFIFSGDGDDHIFGEAGNDELRGGNGKDVLDGGSGDDKIWFGRDGDSARGGTGSDVFILDEFFSNGWGGEVWGGIDVGGADNDTIHFSKDFMDAWGPGWALEYATLGSIAGIKIKHVENLVIGLPDESGNVTYDLKTFTDDFFANRLPGLQSPNTVGTVEKATLFDTDASDRVVYKAEIPFSDNHTITGYSGSFSYMGTQSLVMSLTHWADKVEVTLSLPTGFEYNLDAYNTASFMQQNNFQIDYEYTTSVITDTGIIHYINQATKYYNSFTGVKNSYDNGLTELSGPDVVYTDRKLYDQTTGSTRITYTHDSIEPGKPVRYWISNDTSGLLQIDPETGVVTTQSNLFQDGQTVFATIVASDGLSEVTKDIEVRLDTTLEEAPEFIATHEMQEVLPIAGWEAGTFDWTDGSYGEKWRFAVEVVGETGNDPLFKMEPNGYPVFILARTPTASEIGATHQVKITVTDDTGQSDTTFMNVTIDPIEGTMEGTNGNDYLIPASWSNRIWTINGGDGNDDLDTGYYAARVGKTTLNGGEGDDWLTLRAAHTTGNGDAGDDNISLLEDNTTANGGSGNDTIGSWGYDTLINGNEGNDTITAYYDRATINAGSGNDTIWINSGIDIVVNGGDGDDDIHSNGQATITGGAGADTIYTLNDILIFNSMSDSYLNNVSLTGGTGPEGLWDTIFGVNDDTIIDLSGLGEIEWAGSSTSSTSMLANMFEGDNPGEAFFVIDANRDGGYDFGIELRNIQAANAIHFNGLSDWLM